jgi:hypothetical protein
MLTYTGAGDASQKFVSLPAELQGSTIEIVLVEHAPEQQWYTPSYHHQSRRASVNLTSGEAPRTRVVV